MIKKMYSISGFDCANCASKAEAHLNKDPNIVYARLDFAGNRLYVTYKDEPYTVNQLLALINEVESDLIDLRESIGGFQKANKIFNKSMWILTIRIIISILIVAISAIFLRDEKYYWVNFGLYLFATIILLYDLTYKVIMHIVHRENIIDHNLLINISSIGAFVLASLEDKGEKMLGIFPEHFEAVMVVLLFQIGHMIESIATNKSKAAIMSAVSLRIDYANKITEQGIIKVKPEELIIDDVIIVKAGELIPVDGLIIDGTAFIDSSSLTGEYVPIQANIDSPVYGGCLVKTGTITIKVTKVYSDSTVAKIIELISSGGENKSKADEFIAKFARLYTPIVVGISLITLLILGLFVKSGWEEAIHTALEIIVTGCPCAIVISIPLAYFSAIGLASKNGIVVKGANFLDKLCNTSKLITDKTGTLTHGSFSIQKVSPNNVSEEELIHYLHAAECLSTHPVGKAICHGLNLRKLASEQKEFNEIAGLGVTSKYNGRTIIAGNSKLLEQYNIDVDMVYENGTIIYCAVDNQYIGYVVLSDEIKEDAQPMVDLLHALNVEIILLTGDKEDNAREICMQLGIDRWHSGLLPEQKTDILVREMAETDKSVAFIGDGINDAPSIIRSDIGIAMGGIGSDIAVENADIVIMNDDPAKVYDAIKIAKMARATSMFNLIFAITIKFLVMVLDIVKPAQISDHTLMFISVIADTGLTVLLVINSLLLLYRKVKRVKLKQNKNSD